MFRQKILFGIGFVLTFLLSACGVAAPTMPTADVVAVINTAVAASVTAYTPPTFTPTVSPSPTATPTTYILPTSIPATATSIWYREYYPYYTCADSAFISDVTIPDKTVLSPGETFVKTWRFRNTGSCSWTDDYSLVFVKGNDMDGSDVAIDEIVRINKKVDVSVEMTAPDSEGTYTGYWVLMDDYGYTFGDTVYVKIVVSKDEVTSTPTPSPTFVPSDTPTPTITAGDETEIPSATPTIPSESPTDTSTPVLTDAPTSPPDE